MNIKFTKMHGIGNDFVVIDAYSSIVSLSANQIRAIADRHFGIGCDQLLLVEKSTLPDVDFRYRIFNADGGEVEQCGNGARCFVRFVHDKHLTQKNEIRVETMRGIITLMLENNGQVTVNMGPPRFIPDQIPFIADSTTETYSLDLGSEQINISALSMGNPHAVQIVANTESAPVAQQGPLIEAHPRFPEHVNAGFMQIVDNHHIRLRVFERGSGETLACGSGACAAVVAGIKLGLLNSPVNVAMRGGELSIIWNGSNSDVMMTGPAEPVFDGELDLSRLKI
ncbi:MAG: diaminopimelate epimerase [Methylophilaceae bacterium]|nr:diaminopimelate epimerase [Methyloradius sp.]